MNELPGKQEHRCASPLSTEQKKQTQRFFRAVELFHVVKHCLVYRVSTTKRGLAVNVGDDVSV